MLMVIPDPDRVTSSAPQDIPELGLVVPCRLADTPYTRKDLEALAKQVGAPIIVKDVKDADQADEEGDS
jgi:hypothetical protein